MVTWDSLAFIMEIPMLVGWRLYIGTHPVFNTALSNQYHLDYTRRVGITSAAELPQAIFACWAISYFSLKHRQYITSQELQQYSALSAHVVNKSLYQQLLWNNLLALNSFVYGYGFVECGRKGLKNHLLWCSDFPCVWYRYVLSRQNEL